MAAGAILRLAATPTFAAMAAATLFEPAAPPLCGSIPGWGGMAVMYALMAAFHLPAWLTPHPRGTGQACIKE